MRAAVNMWSVTLVCLGLVTSHEAPAQSPEAAFQHKGPIRSIALLGDGATLVTGGFDSAIAIRDIRTQRDLKVLRFHDSAVTALAALSGDCFASGGDDTRIAVWCGQSETPQHTLSGHRGPISALAAGPVSASWDRSATVWSGGVAQTTFDHAAPIIGLGWLAIGTRLVTASYDGEVRVTRVGADATAARLLHRSQLPVAINALTVGAGKILVASVDGHVRRLGPELGVEAEIEIDGGPLTAITLSADGRTAVAAGIRTPPTIIDVVSGKVVRRLPATGLPIWSLAMSAEGDTVFVGGSDGVLRRWNVHTGAAIGNATAPEAEPLPTSDDHPGARVFQACQVCHAITPESGQRAGPTLHGIMGRRIATAPGYGYSDALRKLDIVWSSDTIARLFEVGPAAMTPGTKMPEQRITDPADRQALVDWLSRVTQP